MPTITDQFLNRPIFRIVSEIAADKGVRAFVIGGYVRDCFLGRPSCDIDIVVEGSGIDFARAVGERTRQHVSYFKNFGTAMLHFRGDEVEFVGARKESYRRESRKPIVENGTLEDDQQRRDFTINAMAFSLQREDFGALVDPFGGIRDLDAGIIRTPLDPDTTYSDDPLRMLRAVRFATKLSTPDRPFSIVPESMASMRRMADRLKILSCERVAEELNKMMVTAQPAMAFRLMDEAGLLRYVLPELLALKGVETVDGRGHKDNFEHSLAVLTNVADSQRISDLHPLHPLEGDGRIIADAIRHVSGDSSAAQMPSGHDWLWLRWAALLHDIGKPASKRYDPAQGWTFHGHEVVGARMVPKIFDRLRLPLDEMKYVQKLVRLHLRPIALVDDGVTDSAVRRLLFDAGDDIDDLMVLCNADITSKNEAKVARIRANFELVKRKLVEVEEKDAIRNFKNPIDGEYVMQVYGIPPCREIGVLKEMVKEAILDGVIGNNFEEADAFMRQHAPELGLHEA